MLSTKKIFLSAIGSAFLLSALAQTLVEKADKQYELHAYRAAAQSYEQLIAKEEDEWAASLKLADCYLHLNELDKAAKQYARAMDDGHTQAADYLRYGRVLMMLGRYDEAEQQFKTYRKEDALTANQFIRACQFAKENATTASAFSVSPLSRINTPRADFGISIWKDQLIWSSTRSDMKRGKESGSTSNGSGDATNQLFAAPIEGVSNQAFKIRFLRSDLKNAYNESNPSYSADGKKVAFMRNNIAEDERITADGGMEMSIYTADVDEDGNWQNIRPFAYNSGATGFPCLTADGKTLYFASTRSGGQGGFDIYKSEWRGTSWGEPRNLGASVNSTGDEITPYFDGKHLYFASDWHAGFGGYDIFRLDGSQVANLGTGINSSNDDFGFVYDPSVLVGFFVSNRKGDKGKDDIYRVESSAETVNLVILDGDKPLKDAKAKVTQGNADNLQMLKSGNYLVQLADGKPLTVEVKKEGFKTQSVKIEPQYKPEGRIVEVHLEKDLPTAMSTIPEYSGMVTDGATGEPLEGVTVRLTHQGTSAQTERVTDAKGRFKFPLSTGANYLLSFSKESFVVSSKFIKASDFKTRYMGEYALKPSALTDKNALETAETPKPMPPKKEIPTVYNTRPSSTTGTSANTPTTVARGNSEIPFFSVQIGVMNKDDILSMNKYADLESTGNVYAIPEGSLKKIRLGVYNSRDEANQASQKAVKLGYKGSFVVEEKNEEAVLVNLYKPIPKPIQPIRKGDEMPKPYNNTTPPRPIKPDTKMPEPYNTALPPKAEDKTFKVRIAAMKKPEWFDDSKVATFWKIETVKEGDLTLFMMDGIKTFEQAKDLKKKVQAAGYKDAKVVVRDGASFRVVD
jgi:tetratricopeptide (TPR) repeat protein/cell division septation protein DedD